MRMFYESKVFECDVCGKRTLQYDGVFSGIGRFCSDKCLEDKKIQLNTNIPKIRTRRQNNEISKNKYVMEKR